MSNYYFMGLFDFFGKGKLKRAINEGAVIIDVRTANEYDQGRIPGSINIPVDRISTNIARIRHMGKPVICVCASGYRSGQAAGMLKKAGISETYNGGNWESLLRLINKS